MIINWKPLQQVRSILQRYIFGLFNFLMFSILFNRGKWRNGISLSTKSPTGFKFNFACTEINAK